VARFLTINNERVKMTISKNATADPQAVKSAQKTWDSFCTMFKYSVYFIGAILVLMAATLVSWS
tara:strand:- start:859493 stop:859684 length:192 start_codon:yes stop_codon:yes gene_type:complete